MSCLNRSNRYVIAVLATACAGASFGQGAPTGTEGDLVGRAQAWLSGRHQVQATAIGVQPLDARVQGRGCPGGWQFDQPIAGNDGMLRARCPDNNWQVYLRIILPAKPTTQAQPSASAAGGPPAAARPPTPSAYIAPQLTIAMPPPPPAPPLVKRGQSVLTTWTTVPGLVVSARMEALDDGRMGETVRLRNRETGRIVSATVSGQNTAQGF